MCGIAGFSCNDFSVSSQVLEKMTSALRHRGPDDQGFFAIPSDNKQRNWKQPGTLSFQCKMGLGNRRLAILDLSERGSQPMHTPDGRFTLSFNGQIYNYVELKRDELSDITFRSTSDTEVLLHCLARFGVSALPKLNGIYAFSFYDHVSKELLLVRDPLGVKPLYYSLDNRGLFYASEIHALLESYSRPPAPRYDLILQYLVSGWIADPDTAFHGIFKLEPGHYLRIREGKILEKKQYWDFEYCPDDAVTEKEWIERLESALLNAMKRQLRSDVPIGFFLSGGVDSSLLTSIGAKHQKNISAFTTSFIWSSKQESRDAYYARKLRDILKIKHHEIRVEPDVFSLLSKIVETLEEPINDPAAICSYIICENAARHFKVLISGQGGDEIFGGYSVYPAGWLVSKMHAMPQSLLERVRSLTQGLPYSFDGRAFQNIHRIKKMMALSTLNWPDSFLFLRSSILPHQISELFTKDALQIQKPLFYKQRELFEKVKHWDLFEQMMYLDKKTYLANTNLTYSDKTSMKHSVELRVPFLDAEIIELSKRIPRRYKVTPVQSKILLKELAARNLPTEMVHRKKEGFGLPVRGWLTHELKDSLDCLQDSFFIKEGLFQRATIERWIREQKDLKADHHQKLFGLLILETWRSLFFEKTLGYTLSDNSL